MKEEKVLVFADGKAAADAKEAGAAFVGGEELIGDVGAVESCREDWSLTRLSVGSCWYHCAHQSALYSRAASCHNPQTRSVPGSQRDNACGQTRDGD
jgi:hypothetical protein